MPIYEYSCASCKVLTSVFVRSIGSEVTATCDSCGSQDMNRVISRVAYHKSGQTRLEEAGPPQSNPTDDYYSDPRNIGRWAEKRLGDMGMDMPEEAQQMIDAARDGELPPAIKDA